MFQPTNQPNNPSSNVVFFYTLLHHYVTYDQQMFCQSNYCQKDVVLLTVRVNS